MEQRYAEWLATVLKNNGGMNGQRWIPTKFSTLSNCLKMDCNAVEWRYTELLATVLKNNYLEVWMTKGEFQPNCQHCPICLKMDWNAVEQRYAEWLAIVLKNNRGYEWPKVNSDQIFNIVQLALKWNRMQQNEGMLSWWPQFWRITEVFMCICYSFYWFINIHIAEKGHQSNRHTHIIRTIVRVLWHSIQCCLITPLFKARNSGYRTGNQCEHKVLMFVYKPRYFNQITSFENRVSLNVWYRSTCWSEWLSGIRKVLLIASLWQPLNFFSKQSISCVSPEELWCCPGRCLWPSLWSCRGATELALGEGNGSFTVYVCGLSGLIDF